MLSRHTLTLPKEITKERKNGQDGRQSFGDIYFRGVQRNAGSGKFRALIKEESDPENREVHITVGDKRCIIKRNQLKNGR